MSEACTIKFDIERHWKGPLCGSVLKIADDIDDDERECMHKQ